MHRNDIPRANGITLHMPHACSLLHTITAYHSQMPKQHWLKSPRLESLGQLLIVGSKMSTILVDCFSNWNAAFSFTTMSPPSFVPRRHRPHRSQSLQNGTHACAQHSIVTGHNIACLRNNNKTIAAWAMPSQRLII